MATEFKLPELGEGIKSASVVRVLVAAGDTVRGDQAVLEVETEKAGLDVPAPVTGTVTEVKVKAGDEVAPGQVLMLIEEGDAAAAAAPAKPAAADTTETAETPVEADEPDLKAEPSQPEKLAEREAEAPAAPPAATEAPAPAAPATEAAAPAAPATPAESDRVPVFASPSVRRFAREVGVDIRRVEGTGPGGRISVDDVKAAARNLGRLSPAADKPVGPDLPEFSRWGAIRVEPLNRVRQAAAKFLHESWTTIPHVTVFDQADVTGLEAWRLSLRRAAERAGVKITVTSILIKLVAKALQAHPLLNASLDLPGGQMVLKDHYHIGVAVDTDRGLVVPTLRDVDQKSLFDVAREMTELADAGRRGKLAPNDMAGASFTVTNLGGIGIGYFTPIIPHPQVGILGVGRAVKQPVWDEEQGEFAPRMLMPLSLSFDHRLVDGADGARFLRWLIDAIEQPLLLLNT